MYANRQIHLIMIIVIIIMIIINVVLDNAVVKLFFKNRIQG